MEIKSLEYKLKYGPAEFLLDTLPPGLLVFLNGKFIEAGLRRMQQVYEPARKFGVSLLISGFPESARETVVNDTFATLATSLIVTLPMSLIPFL